VRKWGARFVRSTLECARRRAAALGGRWNRDDPQRVMLAASARCAPSPSLPKRWLCHAQSKASRNLPRAAHARGRFLHNACAAHGLRGGASCRRRPGATSHGCAHVYTGRGAASHGVCARVHRPWCNVTRGVRTCTPAVVQRHTGCAHVYTGRGAASHGVCARVHRLFCNVTQGVGTCTPTRCNVTRLRASCVSG
jgi:hypothetical protein